MKKDFSVGDLVYVSSKHAWGNSYRGKIESVSEKGTLTIFYPGSAREKSTHRRSKHAYPVNTQGVT